MYNYIVDIETMVLMRYKVAPMMFLKDMTMFDLQVFMEQLTEKVKEEEKQHEKGGKLMKSLAAIREILNYMFLPDSNQR